ncbi:MAG: nucleotidyltransferase family protein [Porticoccaceae bacterium]|jgi:MurNAc alpha-1-phosphate uridylyltransferase|nr:nucleotidyltransferase family protein [Porticoccaceae bacterium]MEA3299473.1 nucleotidyltransferase family protein [Pseudomonadota bacterium]HLS99794.1 nucleotidyltransferase family protein [Porticoccaceae bacterium]
MKAMILAAGFGERLRPLTETTPKPLLEVGGKPMIQYHVERLAAAGIREIIINTSWLGEKIEAFLGDGTRFGVRIAWSRESEPLETGGGIRRALPLLGPEPFLVVNGDLWTDYPFADLVDSALPDDIDAHLVLVPNPPFKAVGDFILDQDLRVGYPQPDSRTYTFSGISLMRPEIFALYPAASERFALRNVLESSIRAASVSGELFEGQWWDVGTVERLNLLNGLLAGKVLDASQKPRMRAEIA